MPTVPLTKRELRQRSHQLGQLMAAWDPIGIMGHPDAPRDEYECLVGPLLTLLQSRATEQQVANYLHAEIVEHFGLAPEHYDFVAVAQRVNRWFDQAWRRLDPPETVYVALLDEGVDVWRPVQARPLGHQLFRLIGVEADVSDETWQFQPGAIVRCESKVFGGGEQGLVAVALAG